MVTVAFSLRAKEVRGVTTLLAVRSSSRRQLSSACGRGRRATSASMVVWIQSESVLPEDQGKNM